MASPSSANGHTPKPQYHAANNDDGTPAPSAPSLPSHNSNDTTPPPSPRINLDTGSSSAHPSPAPNPSHPTTPDHGELPIINSTDSILPAPIIPPYWSHQRSISTNSTLSYLPSTSTSISTAHGSGSGIPGLRPHAIRLEDNTTPEAEEGAAGLRSPLWARMVSIESHVVVSGNIAGFNFGAAGAKGLGLGGGVGDYVVWSCRVGTVEGGVVLLHKRYSEFEALRRELADTFPRAGSSLPVLPPKSVFNRFRPAFLEKRRAGLEYFLNCVLLNPEFASSAVLKKFVFS